MSRTREYDDGTMAHFNADFERIFGKDHDVHPTGRHCKQCGLPLTQGLCDVCDFRDLPPAA